MRKVLYLFNLNDYQLRKSSSEQEFQECFKELLPDLFAAVSYAFGKMCEERSKLLASEQNARWPAEAINRHVYSFLKNNPKTVHFIKKENNTFYVIKDYYKLTFKKVDKRYKPSYHTTESSYLMLQNLTNEDDDKNAVIFIGYQVDATWSELLKISAISRQGNWRIDYNDLEVIAEVSPNIPLTIFQDENSQEVSEEIELKLKSNRKAKES